MHADGMRIRFIPVACGGAEDPLEKKKVRHVSPILLGPSSEKLEHVAHS